jgi:hypothetical protein
VIVLKDDPLPALQLEVGVIDQQRGPLLFQVEPLLAVLLSGSLGSASSAQICPWGWGLDEPIMAPLFSKTCTQR